jgi:hypothetical protein
MGPDRPSVTISESSAAPILVSLQAEVLVALLDPVHRALAGAECLGELGLGPTPVFAGVANQAADLAQVGGELLGAVRHASTISHI